MLSESADLSETKKKRGIEDLRLGSQLAEGSGREWRVTCPSYLNLTAFAE
jgi:hypothetical protein